VTTALRSIWHNLPGLPVHTWWRAIELADPPSLAANQVSPLEAARGEVSAIHLPPRVAGADIIALPSARKAQPGAPPLQAELPARSGSIDRIGEAIATAAG